MIQLVATVVSVGAFIWSFFQPVLAWLPLILATIVLLSVLVGVRFKKWRYVEDLSPSANEMLQKYGHFYAMPFAGRDFSSACSAIQFGAVGVGIVGAFDGFWWGIGVAVLFWFVLGPAAMVFNPTNFIQNQPMRLAAHEEIIQWVSSKTGQRK